MAGLHRPERDDDKLDQIEAVYGDLEALVGKSGEIDQARAEYQKALAKVAEVGQAMEAVDKAGVPGFPREPSHSDGQVLDLLRHMDIKQGEGPVLRAAGMDVLLGLQAGRSARILSEPGVESVKISQPIEFVHDIIHAKSEVGPKASRYLTEDQAMAFIEDLSAEVLKLSEDGAAARRETLQSKIGIAFEHFRTKMNPLSFSARGSRTSRRRGRDVRSAPGVWRRQTGRQRPQTRKGPVDQPPAPDRALSRKD